jgi:hypothetical protein
VLNVDVNNRKHLYIVYERCQSAAALFDQVLTAARNGFESQVEAPNREPVRTLMNWLDMAIGVMRRYPAPRDGRPDLRSARHRAAQVNHARHAIRVAHVAHIALTVFYGGDHESMALFTKTVLGAGRYFQFEIRGQEILVEKEPVFSLALVDSLLKRTKGWDSADDPLGYIADQTRHMAFDEADEQATPADTAPLDEIVGTPYESGEASVTVERVYSFDALKDEARRRGLLKVVAYIEGLEYASAEGITNYREAHRRARQQMGWNKFEASDIRRQFELLRDAAAGLVLRGVVSEASITWLWETFYEGERGREHGGWSFRRPPRLPEDG